MSYFFDNEPKSAKQPHPQESDSIKGPPRLEADDKDCEQSYEVVDRCTKADLEFLEGDLDMSESDKDSNSNGFEVKDSQDRNEQDGDNGIHGPAPSPPDRKSSYVMPLACPPAAMIEDLKHSEGTRNIRRSTRRRRNRITSCGTSTLNVIKDSEITETGHMRSTVFHNYHDYSSKSTDDSTGDISMYGPFFSFPAILHTLLEQAEEKKYSDVISWQHHGRSFLVHDPKRFVLEVMPRYFRQTRFSSFQRQLSLYGFLRLTRKGHPDQGSYYHEMFLRGLPDLCRRIQRTKVKGSQIRQSASPTTEPDFLTMPIVMSQPKEEVDNDEQEVIDHGRKDFEYTDAEGSSSRHPVQEVDSRFGSSDRDIHSGSTCGEEDGRIEESPRLSSKTFDWDTLIPPMTATLAPACHDTDKSVKDTTETLMNTFIPTDKMANDVIQKQAIQERPALKRQELITRRGEQTCSSTESSEEDRKPQAQSMQPTPDTRTKATTENMQFEEDFFPFDFQREDYFQKKIEFPRGTSQDVDNTWTPTSVHQTSTNQGIANDNASLIGDFQRQMQQRLRQQMEQQLQHQNKNLERTLTENFQNYLHQCVQQELAFEENMKEEPRGQNVSCHKETSAVQSEQETCTLVQQCHDASASKFPTSSHTQTELSPTIQQEQSSQKEEND